MSFQWLDPAERFRLEFELELYLDPVDTAEYAAFSAARVGSDRDRDWYARTRLWAAPGWCGMAVLLVLVLLTVFHAI